MKIAPAVAKEIVAAAIASGDLIPAPPAVYFEHVCTRCNDQAKYYGPTHGYGKFCEHHAKMNALSTRLRRPVKRTLKLIISPA